MPRPPKKIDLLASFMDQLASVVTSRVLGALKTTTGAAKSGPKNGRRKRASSLAGKKLDMSCRVAGCKNRSGGPRLGFMCDQHRKKLGKKAQAAAREAWNAKKAAA